MIDQAPTIADPLATIGLVEMVKRTRIPRNTLLKWLARDEANGTPGRSFPRPLPGHKFRWNTHAALIWFERHHAGAKESHV